MAPLQRTLSRLASLWRNLRHRRRIDDDLDAEVRAAFALFVDEQVRAGIDPADARRLATVQLGRMDSVATQVREIRAGAGLDVLCQDLRFGIRLLRRTPLFTFTALLSLAIGIGATTTIFSLVNALLLRDVRVAAPRQLVELWRTTQFGSGTAFSYPAYERLRDENTVLSGVLAMSKSAMAGSTVGGSRAAGRFVSGNFFDVLGLTPAAGRLLSPRDDRPDAPEGSAVAVLAHRFWIREFGGSADALGRTVRIDGVTFTIVGIAPAGFDDLAVGRPADFFIPMGSEPLVRRNSLLRSGPSSWLGIVGRLKPGIGSEAARGNLDTVFRRFMADIAGAVADPEAQQRLRAQRLFVESASNGVSDLRRDFSRPLLLLMGAVTLVLVIACTNVVNLLLSRGVTRRREIALRLAIGAGRSRVVRQLLTESALLGAIGAALGLIVATWGAPLVLRLVTQGGTPIDLDVAPDGRVLFFTAAIAMGASLAAGVFPALRTARADLTPAFQANPRSLSVTRESTRWGQGLIAAQVALSLLLVAGASLLVVTLRNIRGIHPGFDAGHVVLVGVDPSRVGYAGERLTQYYRDLLSAVRSVPGVQAASLSKITPISGGGIDLPITIEGRAREPGVMVTANRMSEGFFATMAIPMLLGRDFVADDAGAGRVIVNEALVQRYFKDENPIGRRFMLMGPRPLEIVGVAANSKYYTLRDPDKPTVYLFGLEGDSGNVTLSVRTAGEPTAFATAIRSRVESVATNVPVAQARTLSSQVDRSLVNERLIARLLSTFAILALILAAVGLYGVLGYSVERRTGEIGLRLALGATRGGVLRSVLRQSAIVVVIGSAVGAAATQLLARPLSGLLYGVTTSDPAVLALAAGCLFVVAMTAAAVPAWRAARVDPLVALRQE
jgi:putative ABC transport system permease protein